MTGLETAVIIVAGMTGFETASTAIATVAAVGIWRGIGAMVGANKGRAARMERLMMQQREADEWRHAEAMRAGDQRRALDGLIRAGQRQHEATMQALERQGAAPERQGAALETVIERTAPKPVPGAPAE